MVQDTTHTGTVDAIIYAAEPLLHLRRNQFYRFLLCDVYVHCLGHELGVCSQCFARRGDLLRGVEVNVSYYNARRALFSKGQSANLTDPGP